MHMFIAIPTIGRFTQQDTHWTNANRIYGDNPQKTNEHEDRLGIQTYAYVPQIAAVMQSGNLYVYCGNDPVMYVDESGELAWPGEIHNQVVHHIASKNNRINNNKLYTEQYIMYKVGWGRADLISESGEVWEVKRDKDKQIEIGKKQIDKYVHNTWKSKASQKLTIGGWIEQDSFVYQNGLSTYYVSYRYAGHGIIAYDYYKPVNWQQIGEIAIGFVLIAGSICLICVTSGAAAPIVIPLITVA